MSSTAQAGTGTSSNVSATSPASRPASFISVEESSGAELSEERNHESEDDGESVRERVLVLTKDLYRQIFKAKLRETCFILNRHLLNNPC